MPSGGERARFLEEESEPRNKLILIDLVSKSMGGIQGGMTPWSQGVAREGEAESDSERWKGEVSSPSTESMGEISGLKNQPAC
jgi:hypothetical protein